MVILYKDGNISNRQGRVILGRSGTVGNIDMSIDTTTSSDEHRIYFHIGGGSHPHNNCYITARIDYTQVRSEDVIS